MGKLRALLALGNGFLALGNGFLALGNGISTMWDKLTKREKKPINPFRMIILLALVGLAAFWVNNGGDLDTLKDYFVVAGEWIELFEVAE